MVGARWTQSTGELSTFVCKIFCCTFSRCSALYRGVLKVTSHLFPWHVNTSVLFRTGSCNWGGGKCEPHVVHDNDKVPRYTLYANNPSMILTKVGVSKQLTQLLMPPHDHGFGIPPPPTENFGGGGSRTFGGELHNPPPWIKHWSMHPFLHLNYNNSYSSYMILLWRILPDWTKTK